MQKKFLLTAFLFSLAFISRAQITGSDTACAGFIYTYNASIAGADSYVWTTPTGWVVLSGAGTSQLQVMCNQNVGQLCVDGYDTAGIFITQYCFTVAWGGSAGGWDVQLNQVDFCGCGIFNVQVISNGGGGCAGCGSGYASPNLVYAVYDNMWGFGSFVMFADNSSPIGPTTMMVTYYVYLVDITFGINNAILIEGGACPGAVNNTFTLGPCWPPIINTVQNPNPVCIGDTVMLAYDYFNGPFSAYSWGLIQGNVTFVSSIFDDSVQLVVNVAGNTQVILQCSDFMGCTYSTFITVNYQQCNNPPSASFSAVTNPICPGTCTGFTNLSTNATSYAWTFTGANPSSSTDVNPDTICYNTPGSYDVQLIATNAAGSDTVFLVGYINVLPYPPQQSISQSEDTLFSNTGFTTYQWYYNGNLIPGATDYFWVASANGDYNVICNDANGCEVEAVIFNVTTGIPSSAFSPLFSIFPNPVEDQLEVRGSSALGGGEAVSEILVYNMIGEKIWAVSLRTMNAELRTVDVRALPSGIYYLEVSDGDKIFRTKFVKQ